MVQSRVYDLAAVWEVSSSKAHGGLFRSTWFGARVGTAVMQGWSICRFLGAVLLVAVADQRLVSVAADNLAQDDLALFRETIEQMDQSADGKIDRAELELLVSELGLEMSEEDLREILDAIAPTASAEDAPSGELTPFAKTAAQYQEHAESGCISAPCANHGICQSRKRRGESGVVAPGDAKYACVCASGWAGITCEQDVDECSSSPCANGARCLDSSTDEESMPNDEPLVPAGVFRCICLGYWGGQHCAEDTRDCLSAPCQNGGGCEPRPDSDAGRRSLAEPSFLCDCAVGFAGLLCQLDVVECASGPCLHDGTCVEPIPGHYKCHCRRGYTGGNCEVEVTHSPCDSTPCDNGGACVETTIGAGSHTLASYKCACQAGYAGMLCNFDLNECASEPCNNGGVCTEPVGGVYVCACAEGWGGHNCALTATEAREDQEQAAKAEAEAKAKAEAEAEVAAEDPAAVAAAAANVVDVSGISAVTAAAAPATVGEGGDPADLDESFQTAASSSSDGEKAYTNEGEGASPADRDGTHRAVTSQQDVPTRQDAQGAAIETQTISQEALQEPGVSGVPDQALGDLRAAAAARLAALAAAKQLRADNARVEYATKAIDGEAPGVAMEDSPYHVTPSVAMDLGSGPDSEEAIRLSSVSQPPPAVSPPSPTPRILDEDDEDIDANEGSHWDPALTALLEQHRLMRLAPGLRALGACDLLLASTTQLI